MRCETRIRSQHTPERCEGLLYQGPEWYDALRKVMRLSCAFYLKVTARSLC